MAEIEGKIEKPSCRKFGAMFQSNGTSKSTAEKPISFIDNNNQFTFPMQTMAIILKNSQLQIRPGATVWEQKITQYKGKTTKNSQQQQSAQIWLKTLKLQFLK